MKKCVDKNTPCGQMNCRCLSWLITGGSLYDQEKEARGYIPYIETVREAVPFFQRGHMVSNQVVGLELRPPEGYYTDLERGKSSVLEGHKWMIEHGVAPSWSSFVTFTGSRIENAPCPPTEYYLDIGMETHKMIMEHNLYPSSHHFFCYRSGTFMINADFARLRWGKVKYNENRDPCMLREEVTV